MRALGRAAVLALALGAVGAGCDDEDDVERAARISRAIQAEPDRTEEILADEDMTIDELEALMYEIASDPEASERYREATADDAEE